MLDHWLTMQYETQTRKQATFELVGLMEGLPDWDIEKIASGMPLSELYGHLDHRTPGTSGVKLAFADLKCAGDGGEFTFLERFKGTPLFDQAIALEQEELQAEMLDQQKRQERRVSSNENQLWDARDQIRLRKRLLELELAKQQNGGGTPVPAPVGPGAEAQGSGAPGPVPAEGVQDSSGGLVGGVAKTGGVKEASADLLMAAEKIAFAAKIGRLLAHTSFEKQADEFDDTDLPPHLVSAYRNFGSKQTTGTKLRKELSTLGGATAGAGMGGALGFGGGMLAKGIGANVDPKNLAMIGAGVLGTLGMAVGSIAGGSHGNTDVALGKAHEHVLRAEDKAFGTGKHAGQKIAAGLGDMIGKSLNGGALGKAALTAMKHPTATGAALGAAGGALAGGPDNRLGGALGGAALGAGAGHAAGGIGGHMAQGASLGQAAKSYGGGMLQKAKALGGGEGAGPKA